MSYNSVPRHEHEDNGEQVYSKAVRAGKRTYFFDVKATRANEYFIAITESRKRVHDDGSVSYTRHQMHLYKEDFTKFLAGLDDTLDYVKEHKPDYFSSEQK